MAGENPIDNMKIVLREKDIPFFSDEELQFYLSANGGNVNDALYQCLCIKAENTTMSLSGFSTGDTSTYFRRLANMYRPSNSGTLGGTV